MSAATDLGRDSVSAGSRAELVRGVSAALALVVGYVPFGLAVGATIAGSGIDPVTGWFSSLLLFAGAAQVAVISMLDTGAAAGIVVATGLVVNARHLLYGAALAPHVRHWPARWRWPAGHLLADPVYALAAARAQEPSVDGAPGLNRAYYFGMGVTALVAWWLLTGAGILLAGSLPAALPLTLAVPLTFLLLLLPSLVDRAAYAAAAAGGVVSLLASGLPLGLGLLAGALTGVAVGAAVSGRADAGTEAGRA